MRTSDKIDQICKALLDFHKEVNRIEKDGENPHFGNSYATIDQIIDEVRPLLAKHGLFVMQMATNDDPSEVKLVTRIYHSSGQWMESPPLTLKPQRQDPQAIGSAVTYARRYSLTSFLSLNTGEDDDGNAASLPQQQQTNQTKQQKQTKQQSKANGQALATDKQKKAIFAIATKKGLDREQVKKLVARLIEREDLQTLTSKEASDIIDGIKDLSKEEMLALIGEKQEDQEVAEILEEMGLQ